MMSEGKRRLGFVCAVLTNHSSVMTVSPLVTFNPPGNLPVADWTAVAAFYARHLSKYLVGLWKNRKQEEYLAEYKQKKKKMKREKRTDKKRDVQGKFSKT